MNRLTWILLGATVMMFASDAAGLAAAAEPKMGEAAPDFELVGSDGKTYKLSDFQGKSAVVVAWFPKAHTPGCTVECKSMRASGDALRKYQVAYFTASVDKPTDNKKFAEDLGLDFPILSDPSHKTALAYGVVDNDKQMARRWTFYITADGKLAAVDKSVKVGSHGPDIAAKLKELGVPEKK